MQQRKACLCYPEDKLKRAWDLLVGFLLLYTCLMVPYRLAFNFFDDDPLERVLINLLIDFMFLADIVV